MVRMDNRCHRVTSKSDDSNSASVMHDVAVRRAAPKTSLRPPKRVICRPTQAHGRQLVRALSQQTMPQCKEVVPHQTAQSGESHRLRIAQIHNPKTFKTLEPSKVRSFICSLLTD